MPTKDNNGQEYFNKLNKTINNFEQRLQKVEKQVTAISKKAIVSDASSTEVIYESSPKRRLGWGIIWSLVVILFMSFTGESPFDNVLSLISSQFRWLLILGLFIAGMSLILANPKQGTVTPIKRDRIVDLSKEETKKEEYKEVKKATSRIASTKKTPKSKSDLESNIGKNWLPKIGIVSIVLGVAFFVIYAIQNKWIGPTGQVALGVIAGIVLITTGEFFSKKNYYNYAMTLVGGGFAVIYFSMFSAYRFYQLLPLYADIGAITVVIIGAVFFSIRYNSTIIAGEAFFLGYIVPLMTSSVNTFFLIYALVLTAGLTALTYFKRWKLLGAGGIASMYVTHIFWLDNYTGTNKNLLHLIFLFIYFVMFAIMAVKIKEDAKNEIDKLFNSRNVVAAVFIVTYLFLFQLDFNNVFFIISPLILLLLLLSFFVVKFNWDYFTVGGILMTFIVHWKWLSQNFNDDSVLINFVALSVYFLLFNILSFFLNREKNNTSNVVGILLNSLFYYGLNIWPIIKLNKGYEGLFTAVLAAFYLVLSYIAHSKKMAYYFNTYLVLCFGYLTLAIPLQFNREWITISWVVLTLILVILSFRLKENVVRLASTIVGILTFGRLLLYDSWNLRAIDFANPVNSTRLFAFVATITIFYIIAYLYNKNKDNLDYPKNYLPYVNAFYAIAATILTTVVIWLEIWDTGITLNAKKLWTSLSFVIQAIVILGFGFSAKIKLFRIMGLILFGLAITKVFLYDLSNLETGYRIFSFIVLGVIALLGAFLYNKYKEYI